MTHSVVNQVKQAADAASIGIVAGTPARVPPAVAEPLGVRADRDVPKQEAGDA